jgi:lipopolysaccharide export system protein LptC
MPHIHNKNSNPLKLFLLSVIFITLCSIIAVFVKYRHFPDKKDNLVVHIKNKANISLGKIHQTATRNGITEWSLDAASVDYTAKKNRAIFQDLYVTFYLKNNTEIYLTANQGILKTDSNDIEVFGNVVVKNENYSLKTETLHYQHNERIIYSKVPVVITGNSMDLVADSMSLNLNTNKTLLQGQVAGTIREKIIL